MATRHEQWKERRWTPGKYAREVWVVVDAASEAAAFAAVGIAGMSIYQRDGTLFAEAPEIRAINPGHSYELTFTWRPLEQMTSEQISVAQAIAEPAAYSFAYQRASVPADKDAQGVPAINSAGDPLETTFDRSVTTLIFYVERNEATFDPLLPLDYVDHVNSNAVVFMGKTFDPGLVCCREYAPVGVIHAADPYVRIRYGFEFSKNGFYEYRMDQGYRGVRLNGGTLEHLDLEDKNGQKATTAVPLDGTGRPIDTTSFRCHGGYACAQSGIAMPNPQANIFGGKLVSVSLKFSKYPTADFGPLGVF